MAIFTASTATYGHYIYRYLRLRTDISTAALLTAISTATYGHINRYIRPYLSTVGWGNFATFSDISFHITLLAETFMIKSCTIAPSHPLSIFKHVKIFSMKLRIKSMACRMAPSRKIVVWGNFVNQLRFCIKLSSGVMFRHFCM